MVAAVVASRSLETGTLGTRCLPRIGVTTGSGVKVTPEFDPLEDISSFGRSEGQT